MAPPGSGKTVLGLEVAPQLNRPCLILAPTIAWYYALMLIGRNKNLDENFKKHWEQQLGSCELIFTRSLEGCKLLLKARVSAAAAH